MRFIWCLRNWMFILLILMRLGNVEPMKTLTGLSANISQSDVTSRLTLKQT